MARPTDDSCQLLPKKKRRWTRWLKRLLVTAVVLFFVVNVLHIIWDWRESKLLNEQLAGYKAAGQPVVLADFLSPPVPDEQNAAVVLQEVGRKLVDDYDPDDPGWKTFGKAEWTAAHPMTEAEAGAYRDHIARYEAFLDLPSRAAKRPKVDWQIPYATPVLLVEKPHLQRMRSLANLLAQDAMLARHDGDYSRALRRVRGILYLGESIEQSPVLIIDHLVALGFSSMACDVAIKTAQMLTDDETPANGARPWNRDEAHALITALIDTSHLEDTKRTAWLGERMSMLDAMDAVAAGQWGGLTKTGVKPNSSNVMKTYTLRPLAHREARFMGNAVTRRYEASAATDLPTYRAAWAKYKAETEPDASYRFAKITLPSLNDIAEQDYRVLNERRLAATLLALRLYAHDHAGDLPPTLSALVPKYLPSVPLDALTAGQPLRYDRDAAIVWSVGKNGVDDGGYEPPITASRKEAEAKGDEVRHLRLPPRTQWPVDEDEIETGD